LIFNHFLQFLLEFLLLLKALSSILQTLPDLHQIREIQGHLVYIRVNLGLFTLWCCFQVCVYASDGLQEAFELRIIQEIIILIANLRILAQ